MNNTIRQISSEAAVIAVYAGAGAVIGGMTGLIGGALLLPELFSYIKPLSAPEILFTNALENRVEQLVEGTKTCEKLGALMGAIFGIVKGLEVAFTPKTISPDEVASLRISPGTTMRFSSDDYCFYGYNCKITLVNGKTAEAVLGPKNAYTLVHSIPAEKIKSDFNLQNIDFCSKRVLPSAKEILTEIFNSKQKNPIQIGDLPG